MSTKQGLAKLKRIFTILSFLIIAVNIALSATIYVNDDAAGNNDGTTWADAYNVLQDAIDAASPGDQLWVASGRYIPTANGAGRGVYFRTSAGIEWYGGFSGDETSINERENYRRGEENETILSGDLNGNGRDNSDSYHVILQPLLSTDLTAIIDGFSITGGNANDAVDAENQRGAGIYFDDIQFTVRNCHFYDNFAMQGGAVTAFSGSPVFENCIFEDNTATGDGGGMYILDNSTVTLTNCLVRANQAANGAGLAINNSSSYILNNVTITENAATGLGGGIYLETSGSFTLNNSILWGNTATTGAEANIAAGSATLNFSLYGNSGNDIAGAGTFTAINNNLTSNPLFVNAAAQNYVPAYNSPLLDAGSNALNSTTTDIRGPGFERKLNSVDSIAGIIDIGAYEYKFGIDANIPSVEFYQPSKQKFNTLLYNGAVTDDGNLTTQRGFVYSNNPNPEIGSAVLTSNGSGEGAFQQLFQDQPPGIYYARAWATNPLGTTYGTERTYTIYPIAIDGNQDGTPDSVQSHVFTILSFNQESYITLVAESGKTVYDVAVKAESDQSDEYYYPYGLVEFKIDESIADVDLIFHSAQDLSTGNYKKIDSLTRYLDFNNAVYSTQIIGGSPKAVVTLSLRDGEFGDFDQLPNGTIHDPGGPTLPVPVIIPVWDWWWVLLLLGGGWVVCRRIA
jgi:parallel beta-helix repeat protein